MKTLFQKSVIILEILYLAMSFVPLTHAEAFSNDDLMTRIVLDPTLKPDNSPGVVVDPKTLDSAGAETAFANYMLQVLAGGLITVAAPVAIIIIAISGLIAVVSHGDQKYIDRAKSTLTWAIIGLIIIIFSWVIVRTTIEVVLTVNNSPAAAPAGQQPAPPAPGGADTSATGTNDPE